MTGAVHWLLNIQNADGGWEWSSDSYKLDYKGYKPEPSTSNQTAWALLALMSADEAKHMENGNGKWDHIFAKHSRLRRCWLGECFSNGGFPQVLYFQYHGYLKFLPLWALAHYHNILQNSSHAIVVEI
jgi:squalene-hopene/tetraprenyl-beta-curcumene cyclase